MLAMESELSASLPKSTEFGKELGKRFGVSGDLVMKRYRVIYEEIEAWSIRVPWLGEIAGERNATGGKKKSVKLSKRTAVAQVLKDVIQHQEGVWQERLRAQPSLENASDGAIEYAEVSSPNLGSNSRIDEEGYSGQDTREAGSQERPELVEQHALARRKKRTKGGELAVASRFLLSPSDGRGSETVKRARTDGVMGVDTDKLAHFLTSDTASFTRPPTRLQLLSSQRREDDIADEELFGEGEMENIMRSEQEREVLKKALGWDQGEDDRGRKDDDSEGRHTTQARRRDRDRGGTTRVNMEALQRLLAESESEAVIEEATYDDDKGEFEGKDWDDWTNLYGMEECFEKEG
jgi:transcription factor IIIB subunit 2